MDGLNVPSHKGGGRMHGGMAYGGPALGDPARARGALRERLGVVAPGHRRFSNQSKAWYGGGMAGRRRFGLGESASNEGSVSLGRYLQPNPPSPRFQKRCSRGSDGEANRDKQGMIWGAYKIIEMLIVEEWPDAQKATVNRILEQEKGRG